MALVRLGLLINAAMLGALSLASLSFAAESTSTAPDAEFMKMDTNKDGKLSATEHPAEAKTFRRDGCQ